MTYQEMHDILNNIAPTAPPECSQYYTGSASQYITYFIVTDNEEAHGNNSNEATTQYWQIDIWQKIDYDGGTTIEDITENINTSLKQHEFMGFSCNDLYENNTKINHRAIRCCCEK